MENEIKNIIARDLQLSLRAVENTLALLGEGCTIPFISRYRKEKTGGLDEVQTGSISQMYDKLEELIKRKETILKTIEGQGKLTPELKSRIENCWDSTQLEDIYLPYKPKRRTRAQIAREQGLEPLATAILQQREAHPERLAERYVKGDVKDVDAAIKGAQDIIAENVSEDETTRNRLRATFKREAYITSKVKSLKSKEDEDKAAKYSDYFDFEEPLRRCSGNRLLAMRRGESEGILRISISPLQLPGGRDVANAFLRNKAFSGNSLACRKLIDDACEDALKRLLLPSIENEFAASSKQKADEEAIGVFAENLRQLLLAAPLGQKRVMGIDPGIRTGCKVVCLDAQGNLLYHTVCPLRLPLQGRDANELISLNTKSVEQYKRLIERYNIEAIAVGNGTASREASSIAREAIKSPSLKGRAMVGLYVVSEDGASVYSASKVARDEFPDEDVTVRGAVSIGRRLMDPLAELVKIDPKSIGVGQYQHDVDQSQLKASLDRTVESCVNSVGVDLNTASIHLLTYVSGLGPTLAKNIVEYRKENGAFTSRAQLKKVPRLGPSAFQQCAGFLRIQAPTSSTSSAQATSKGVKYNPLDGSAVHPESYPLAEQMAKDLGCTIQDLIDKKELRDKVDVSKYKCSPEGGWGAADILKELEKPGRDPRAEIETFDFDPNVHNTDDLIEGMVLPGIVTNITKFGAFVDVGVHQDGLVHISQMADKYISDPSEVVHLHQHVKVKVLEVDHRRNRISLTMKNL